MRWDPQQYARYDSERNRPFFDLVGQIGATSPAVVVDLGCGPGELTAALASRWPSAMITGLDSSPEMIERTAAYAADRVSFALADAAHYSAVGVDVLVSNALLQWVPDHRALLSRWARELNAGGWLAFQVPDNFSSPSHVLMRELAESERWTAQLGGLLRHSDATAPVEEYLALLASCGLRVNAWQTTYEHVLAGDNPVLEWVRGTGLRPVLGALSTEDAAEFESAYAAALRSAYPITTFGTVFPFRRTFVVAAK
jgi:trans-aconitate 2-methyltransferase